MRPRPMTAENTREETTMNLNDALASMRPRPMTAENGASAPTTPPRRTPRFNEAAADDRGKPARNAPRPTPSSRLQ